MAEVDTSIYKLPTQQPLMGVVGSIADTVNKVQSVERNRIGIDAAKLDLINTNYSRLITELNSLPPEATADDMRRVATNAVKLNLIKPEMAAEFISQIPTDPNQVRAFRDQTMSKLMTTQEALNYQYGQQNYRSQGQQVTPTLESPRFGMRPSGDPVQLQEPPGTPSIDSDPNSPTYWQPRNIGPQAPRIPAGRLPVQGGMPGQFVEPNSQPQARSRIPVQQFGESVIGAGGRPPMAPPTAAQTVDNRFPTPAGAVTGLPPGEKEVLEAGGVQLAGDQKAAANYAREVLPLQEAIINLEKLGPQGTGPGSETFNTIKSFLVANVPGIDPNDPAWNSVQMYDKAKKYLQDVVNSQGLSAQSVQHLASSITGNPSTSISNAASVDVAKMLLAMRRMKQAQYTEWQKQNLPANQYPKWSANFANTVDPRAFGFDLLGETRAREMLKGMSQAELARFQKSYDVAKSSNVFLGGAGR